MKHVFLKNIFSLVLGLRSAKASRKLNATNMCVETAAQAVSTHLLPLLALQKWSGGMFLHKYLLIGTAGEQNTN